MKLLTKEIEERLQNAPLYSKDGKGKDAEVLVRFSIPNIAEYLVTEAEQQPDGSWLMFSYGKFIFGNGVTFRAKKLRALLFQMVHGLTAYYTMEKPCKKSMMKFRKKKKNEKTVLMMKKDKVV